MNKNIKNLFTAFAACLIVIAMNSCGDKANLDGSIAPATGARVKFFNAVAAGTPLIITQNGQKWTSVLSTTKYTDSIPVAGLYPQIDYAALPAGSTKFQAKLPLSVNAKDTVVSELTLNLENDKYYLLVAADSFPTPKLYVVPDTRDDSRKSDKSYFNFANFLMKSPAVGYDCYLSRQKDKPFATIKYGETSPLIEFEPTGTVADTVFLRESGKTVNAFTFAMGANKFEANRNFIVIIRGIVGGTGTKAPTVGLLRTK